VCGQEKYFVLFTDKSGTPYSIENPSEFLTHKSIERRNKQGIEITERDLPVSGAYIDQVKETGANILYSLRWFNGIVVETYSVEMALQIANLSSVCRMEMIFEPGYKSQLLEEEDIFQIYSFKRDDADFYYYGSSSIQVKMLNGHVLHNMGYRGNGMTIALLDAGFYNVNSLPAFDSINSEGRIIYTKDFVNSTSNIFEEHTHGMIVLSAMAGNIPGELIGTAPEANYILIRTEDANNEQIIEEYNWAAGAELADSLGADVINSSLGYNIFDAAWQNYTYNDLNGQTTPSARAAKIAADVGMLVVISAGNEGSSSWKYISTPADGINCISVGAVDKNGQYVSFSSTGPSADGRLKPEVVAMGKGTVIQSPTGLIGSVNGTSLSAPIISGLAACLWQACPNLSAVELSNSIFLTASNINTPNFQIGYGMPNFQKALEFLNILPQDNNTPLKIFPNPSTGKVNIMLPWQFNSELSLWLLTSTGKVLYNKKNTPESSTFYINIPENCPSGLYLIKLSSEYGTKFGKVIKQSF
jgi:hypothetical protein